MTDNLKKLNLGCGTDIKAGWTNLDRCNLPGVDTIHDIEDTPLPFKDNTFDYVLCNDVLEHVNFVKVLKDIHRILKKGGICEIRTPHFGYHRAYEDPTHINYFASKTFDFFVKDHPNNYYFDFAFEKAIHKKIKFLVNIFFPYKFIVEKIVNINDATRLYYEQSFLRSIITPENIHIKLQK